MSASATQGGHRQRQKQNLTQFTACGKYTVTMTMTIKSVERERSRSL